MVLTLFDREGKDIVKNVCVEWLSLRELAHFDSVMCNYAGREQLLQCLDGLRLTNLLKPHSILTGSNFYSFQLKIINDRVLRWIARRRLLPTAVSLNMLRPSWGQELCEQGSWGFLNHVRHLRLAENAFKFGPLLIENVLLPHCRLLEYFELSSPEITDDQLINIFSQNPRLKTVVLRDTTQVSTAVVETLSRFCPLLESFEWRIGCFPAKQHQQHLELAADLKFNKLHCLKIDCSHSSEQLTATYAALITSCAPSLSKFVLQSPLAAKVLDVLSTQQQRLHQLRAVTLNYLTTAAAAERNSLSQFFNCYSSQIEEFTVLDRAESVLLELPLLLLPRLQQLQLDLHDTRWNLATALNSLRNTTSITTSNSNANGITITGSSDNNGSNSNNSNSSVLPQQQQQRQQHQQLHTLILTNSGQLDGDNISLLLLHLPQLRVLEVLPATALRDATVMQQLQCCCLESLVLEEAPHISSEALVQLLLLQQQQQLRHLCAPLYAGITSEKNCFAAAAIAAATAAAVNNTSTTTAATTTTSAAAFAGSELRSLDVSGRVFQPTAAKLQQLCALFPQLREVTMVLPATAAEKQQLQEALPHVQFTLYDSFSEYI